MSTPILIYKEVQAVDHAATGEKLRVQRVIARKSLRQVAEVLGYSAAYLSDLERGRTNWTEEKATAFLKALQ